VLWRSPHIDVLSDNARAAGMGIAVAGASAITLLFTIAFARLLGTSGYGSLATLTSAFFIASIPGTAMQTAVAREVSAAAASGHDDELARDVQKWTGTAAMATATLAVLSIALRVQVADALGVDQVWAAALVLPTGGLWLLVSLQRGVLQGIQSYRVVGVSVIGEALARLALGLVLVGAGLGVTGAFGGLTAALVLLAVVLRRHLSKRKLLRGVVARRTLRSLLRDAGAPLVAIGLLALLQNLDVIVVKHVASPHAAGIYAAASFSAKALVWIAVGLGMYLLPETSRRFHQGGDTRRLFLVTLMLMAGAAAPALTIFVLAGRPLLDGLFGGAFVQGAHELPLLGVAMTALAFTFLCVQYLIGLRHARFLWLLVGIVVAEPIVLAAFGDRLVELAAALLGLQLLLALVLMGLALHRPAAVGRVRQTSLLTEK
jgi:O-antigen/teichoic acid export membrane protein